jgi:hypothetical protein
MLAAMDDRRDRFADLNERARRAFLQGAAEEWTRLNGRPPTAEQPIVCSYATQATQCRPGGPSPDCAQLRGRRLPNSAWLLVGTYVVRSGRCARDYLDEPARGWATSPNGCHRCDHPRPERRE